MPQPSRTAAAPVRDPLTIQAARIAAVAAAASMALSGCSLTNPRAAEDLAIDLMDVVALLAARLASDAEILESQTQGA